MVRQGDGAWADHAAAAADQRGAGGGMVRRAERWVGEQRRSAGRAPATEWMADDSSAAAGSSRGSRVGSRRRAWSCPRRAGRAAVSDGPGRAKFRGQPGCGLADDVGEVGPAGWSRAIGLVCVGRLPRASWLRSGRRAGPAADPGPPGRRRVRAAPGTPSGGQPLPASPGPGQAVRGQDFDSGTRLASAALAAGTTTVPNPALLTAATLGSTPRTARTRPSRPSSPRNIRPGSRSAGTAPAAARIDTRYQGQSSTPAWAGWPATGPR